MTDHVQQEIIAIVADVSGLEPEEISLDAKFTEELEIDSIKAIEITVAIERTFKITVRDEDVPKITTVRQAIDLARQLLKAKHEAAGKQ